MDPIQTHPSTAMQAKAFTAPGSLSFPSAGELTPPSQESDKMMQHQQFGMQQRPAMGNGMQQQQQLPNGGGAANGTGVTPATPVATPAAGPGGSGLLPTLQYVFGPAVAL